MKNCWAE